jgi:hypothetical protein
VIGLNQSDQETGPESIGYFTQSRVNEGWRAEYVVDVNHLPNAGVGSSCMATIQGLNCRYSACHTVSVAKIRIKSR